MSQHDIDPIETLRAELSRVEVSPDFAERVRRQIGQDAIASIRQDAIASIGAELSELSVSPEFAVRVRQQIEDAPAQSRWFGMFNWRWAVPVAAAAAIVGVRAQSRRRADDQWRRSRRRAGARPEPTRAAISTSAIDDGDRAGLARVHRKQRRCACLSEPRTARRRQVSRRMTSWK